MSDDNFPWFTEWFGIFMPLKDALGYSCVTTLVLIIFTIFGFLIYLFFKLIVEGFKAIKRNDWGKAFVYLLVPGLILFCCIVSTMNVASEVVAEEYRYNLQQTQEAQRIIKINQLSNQMPDLLKIDNVRRTGCTSKPSFNICREDGVEVWFTLINNSETNIDISRELREQDWHSFHDCITMDGKTSVGPYQTIDFGCLDSSASQSDNFTVVTRDGHDQIASDICFNFKPKITKNSTLYEEYNYVEMPTFTKCVDIPTKISPP